MLYRVMFLWQLYIFGVDVVACFGWYGFARAVKL